jgi:ankyrin repeat protein
MRKDVILQLINQNPTHFRAQLLTGILMQPDFRNVPEDGQIPFITILLFLQSNGMRLIEDISQNELNQMADGELFFWFITGQDRQKMNPSKMDEGSTPLPLLPKDICGNISRFYDTKTLVNLSACSHALYSHTTSIASWEDKIRNLGFKKSAIDKVLAARVITNYKLFYYTLDRVPYTQRYHLLAWELYCLSGEPVAIDEAIYQEKLTALTIGYRSRNALHYAAWSGHIAGIKYVRTQLGIHVESTNESGLNVLNYAGSSGNIEAIEFVINELNIDINHKTNAGTNFLHSIAISGNLETIKYFTSDKRFQYLISNKDNYQANLLHYAAGNDRDNINVLEYLIKDLKFDPHKTDQFGNNLLHEAAACGKIKLMGYIVSNLKIDKESSNSQGKNALYFAVFSNNIEAVKYAIEILKIDKNSRDQLGRNILFYAKSIRMLQYILNDLAIPLNSVDNDNDTVFHVLSRDGNVELIYWIRLFATQKNIPLNLNLANTAGQNVLDLALLQTNAEELKKAWRCSEKDVINYFRDELKQGIAAREERKCVVM